MYHSLPYLGLELLKLLKGQRLLEGDKELQYLDHERLQ